MSAIQKDEHRQRAKLIKVCPRVSGPSAPAQGIDVPGPDPMPNPRFCLCSASGKSGRTWT